MPLQDHINANEGYSNRVADAIYLYAEQDTQLKINNPLESRYGMQAIALKLQYYSSIDNAFRRNPNPDEKLSLRFVRHEMAKMRARLNPTTLNRVLYSNFSNLIRNFTNGNNLLYAQHNNTIKKIEREMIQEHNLQSLTASMKKTGFTFEIEGTLKKMIAQELPQFHIRYSDIHYPKADFVLHFMKIPQTDLYYLEKFDTVSRPSLDALIKNDPSCIRHTFSLQDNMSFTAGEAANLVNGKCVYRNVNEEMFWLGLDTTSKNGSSVFKTISFDLESALEKLPVQHLDNPKQYNAILEALKSGSSKDVTLNINGGFLKCRIEAAPDRNAIDILDKNNRLMDIDKLLSPQHQRLTQKLMEKISQQEDEIIDLKPIPISRKLR